MTVTLREFDPHDYADLACIHNANYPLRSRTADTFIEADRNRSPKCRARRWVACVDGRMVGFGAYDQDIYDYHPRRFYIGVSVLPEHQRCSIGAALYDQVMAGLSGFDPQVLRGNAFSTQPDGLRFLEKRGFREVWRETPNQLDVAGFDPSPHTGLEQKLRREGFEIKTLRELEGDPDRDRKVYDLYWQIYDTLPHEESEVVHMDFEDWAAATLDEDQTPLEAFLIVTHGEEYIGFKEMCLDPSDRNVLQGGLLGVLPAYRRRGIALALQLRAIAYARANSYGLIKSSTGAEHGAMQSLFAKLGYVNLYDWYQMEKRLP